jgi:D-3-phosphoglycerate dehydrogenase
MKNIKYYIFDFDSTLVQVETLDELAKICLQDNPDKKAIIKKIKATTKLGMEGKISFNESLKTRLTLIKPHKEQVNFLVKKLVAKISPSLLKNLDFIKNNCDRIYIISGGFKECILPVANKLGIKDNHILANTFIFDRNGKYLGFDDQNPLAQKDGKAKAVELLKLKGEIVVIGDGYTDWKIKAQGAADYFIAFTETVKRPAIIDKADWVIDSFDDLIKFM